MYVKYKASISCSYWETDLSSATEHFFWSAVNHKMQVNIRYSSLISVSLPQRRGPTTSHDKLHEVSLGAVKSRADWFKLTMSLKFQMLTSEICQYFLLKRCEKLLHCKSFSHFFNKKFSVFGYKVVKHLTSWPLSELVKLTMLRTNAAKVFNVIYATGFGTWQASKRSNNSSHGMIQDSHCRSSLIWVYTVILCHKF